MTAPKFRSDREIHTPYRRVGAGFQALVLNGTAPKPERRANLPECSRSERPGLIEGPGGARGTARFIELVNEC